MSRWRWTAAAAVAGVLVGFGLAAWWGASSRDEALRAQRADLDRLKASLHDQEAALAQGRTELAAEADRIHRKLTDAVGRADALVTAQGTAVEKLKKITTGLKALRDELAAN